MNEQAEKAEQLRATLIELLGAPVDLTITDNRRSMISYRWTENRRLTLRVHQMFLQGSRRNWRTIASFCKNPTAANRAAINRFIREHQGKPEDADASPARAVTLQPCGRHYDLTQVFDLVNRKHFKRQCDAKITWSKAPRRRRRRGLQLGSYDPHINVIRMHPVLDREWVPSYILEFLVYHEMLHWLFRPRVAGGRRVIHGPAFIEAEKSHPYYQRYQLWVKKNLDRLLRI